MVNSLLNKLIKFKNDVNQFDKVIDKKNYIKKTNDKDLLMLLKYIYDPLITFGVTSYKIKKFKFDKKNMIRSKNSFLYLLKSLENRTYIGNVAVEYILSYIHKNPDYEDIIYDIIDKDLRIRIGTKIIAECKPGLIQIFKVALAKIIPDNFINNIGDAKWFISRKYDGIRCITLIKGKEIKFFSRTGHEIFTLDKIKEDIEKMLSNNVEELKKIIRYDGIVFDGEIITYDEHNEHNKYEHNEHNKYEHNEHNKYEHDNYNEHSTNESFKSTMEEIGRKEHVMKNPIYKIFDILSFDEFKMVKTSEILYKRISYLESLLNLFAKSTRLQYVKQYLFTPLMFDKLLKLSKKEKWEGLILRKDATYKNGRTSDMLKIKSFEDAEFKVIGVEIDYMTMPYKVNNEYVKKKVLSAVIIDYNNTKVGSGFTINERKYYSKNPNEIINKIITVKYMEKTKKSLRIPIFKGIHGVKRIY